MELYQLEHPPDRILLCSHSDCNEIADYLELTEDGGEEVLCASHTSSDKHVSVLRKRACHTGHAFRSRPAAA
jgi:hypothetical protein